MLFIPALLSIYPPDRSQMQYISLPSLCYASMQFNKCPRALSSTIDVVVIIIITKTKVARAARHGMLTKWAKMRGKKKEKKLWQGSRDEIFPIVHQNAH